MQMIIRLVSDAARFTPSIDLWDDTGVWFGSAGVTIPQPSGKATQWLPYSAITSIYFTDDWPTYHGKRP